MSYIYSGIRNPVNAILDDCSSEEKLKESLFEYFEIGYYDDYDKKNIDSMDFVIEESDTAYTVEIGRKDPRAELLQSSIHVRVLKENCKIIYYRVN